MESRISRCSEHLHRLREYELYLYLQPDKIFPCDFVRAGYCEYHAEVTVYCRCMPLERFFAKEELKLRV